MIVCWLYWEKILGERDTSGRHTNLNKLYEWDNIVNDFKHVKH